LSDTMNLPRHVTKSDTIFLTTSWYIYFKERQALEHNTNDSMQYVQSVAGDRIIIRWMWLPRLPHPTDFSRGTY